MNSEGQGGQKTVILPTAIALIAAGALVTYLSTWWTVARPGEELRLLATIVVLGAIAVTSVVYWVAIQAQARADERYNEFKILAEKVANAMTQSAADGRPVAAVEQGSAELAEELAEIRSSIARIERIAVREGEAYLTGYMARVAEEDGKNGPPVVA